MWIERDFESSWERDSAPVRVCRGVRQCGKSAVLEHLIHGRAHVTLDDFSLREAAQRDPRLFLDIHGAPLVVDEIQYAPNLFPEMKRRVDLIRKGIREGAAPSAGFGSSGLYWVTGSNQILMRKSVQESMAGRASYSTLHPFSVREILRAKPETPLADLFLRGGWPELHLPGAPSPVVYLNDYISTVLEKDVSQSAGIQKVHDFGRVLRLGAARIGSLLNMSSLAGDAGVQVSTIGDWLGFLEEMLFVTRLRPFHSNLNKRLVKSPKFYFNDVGLALRLQGWTEAAPALVSTQAGGLFETLVWSELLKTRDHNRRPWEFFFWRTKEGEEIDFLIHTAEKTLALEVKFASQSLPRDLDFSGPTKVFGSTLRCAAVVATGERRLASAKSPTVIDVIPLAELADYVLDAMG